MGDSVMLNNFGTNASYVGALLSCVGILLRPAWLVTRAFCSPKDMAHGRQRARSDLSGLQRVDGTAGTERALSRQLVNRMLLESERHFDAHQRPNCSRLVFLWLPSSILRRPEADSIRIRRLQRRRHRAVR